MKKILVLIFVLISFIGYSQYSPTFDSIKATGIITNTGINDFGIRSQLGDGYVAWSAADSVFKKIPLNGSGLPIITDTLYLIDMIEDNLTDSLMVLVIEYGDSLIQFISSTALADTFYVAYGTTTSTITSGWKSQGDTIYVDTASISGSSLWDTASGTVGNRTLNHALGGAINLVQIRKTLWVDRNVGITSGADPSYSFRVNGYSQFDSAVVIQNMDTLVTSPTFALTLSATGDTVLKYAWPNLAGYLVWADTSNQLATDYDVDTLSLSIYDSLGNIYTEGQVDNLIAPFQDSVNNPWMYSGGYTVQRGSGNVGIGTMSPGAKLEVRNDANFPTSLMIQNNNAGTNAQTMITFKPSGNNADAFFWFDMETAPHWAVGVDADDGNKFKFASNSVADVGNTALVTIQSDGNVGISTTAPDKKLEINTGASDNGIRLSYNDADGSATNYTDLITGADGDLTITTVDSDGALGHIALMPDGNVGVGTLTPDGKVNIVDGGAITHTYLKLDNYSANTAYLPYLQIRKSYTDTKGSLINTPTGQQLGTIRFSGVGTNQAFFYPGADIGAIQDGSPGANYVPTNLILKTCTSTGFNDNQLVLHNDGNVGIMNETPDSTLTVTGSAHITTNVKVDGRLSTLGKVYAPYLTGTATFDSIVVSETTTNLIKKALKPVNLYSSQDSTKNPWMYSGGYTVQRTNRNVGMQTTVPDKKLEINTGASDNGIRISYNDADGSAANYCDLITGADGDLTITTVDDGAGVAGHIALMPDGKVGVKTLTPDSTLTVTGSGRFSTNLKVGAKMYAPGLTDAASEDTIVGYKQSTGEFTAIPYTPGISIDSSMWIHNDTRKVTSLRYTTDSVSIGHSLPTAKLDVKSSTGTGIRSIVSSDMDSAAIWASSIYGPAVHGESAIGYGGYFKTGETVSLYSDQSTHVNGRLGVGVSPTAFTGEAKIYGNKTTYNLLDISNDDAASGTKDSTVVVDKLGNVGIHTTTPLMALDIRSTGGNYGQIQMGQNPGNASYGAIYLHGRTTENNGYTFMGSTYEIPSYNTLFINRPWGGAIDFQKYGTTQVRIDSSGNVGINKLTPLAKLHVNGGVMMDGKDTSGVGSTAKIGIMQYYNGHFYGLIAGSPPLWKQLDN